MALSSTSTWIVKVNSFKNNSVCGQQGRKKGKGNPSVMLRDNKRGREKDHSSIGRQPTVLFCGNKKGWKKSDPSEDKALKKGEYTPDGKLFFLLVCNELDTARLSHGDYEACDNLL
ncbi:hypothetical protein AVEN_199027-1 [Araneus ventricosus]|uniref:Uncharacterized protein n=1 Tax=Araneus ventricosus TaxID=182803 RepID=A0A4Y2SGZ3_ARAVE|nr:hypothetical protein AVEN_199027-1 [Araneus ventricosus]